MKRVVLVCPGRGSYTRDRLGSLVVTPSVTLANTYRAALGRPTPAELDAAESYSSRLHIAGENASILTMACSLSDADQLQGVEVVGVIGNSMGWYTALSIAGALPLRDGLRLVETMAQYQADNVIGGQVLYPVVDEDWRPLASPELELALKEIPDLHVSIRLGGQVILGGSNEALARLMSRLPPRRAGERDAPFQLPLHSAFHTPLMAGTGERARADLADLPWQSPWVPLIDGSGRLHPAGYADPAAIRDWTLGAQVTEAYDFTKSVRVALAELAPDALVLLGPGGNLGGACGQVMVQSGWRNVRSRADFQTLQASDPFVLAMARPEQRALVT